MQFTFDCVAHSKNRLEVIVFMPLEVRTMDWYLEEKFKNKV